MTEEEKQVRADATTVEELNGKLDDLIASSLEIYSIVSRWPANRSILCQEAIVDAKFMTIKQYMDSSLAEVWRAA